MPSPEKSKSLESWIWDAACSIRGAKDEFLPLLPEDPEQPAWP